MRSQKFSRRTLFGRTASAATACFAWSCGLSTDPASLAGRPVAADTITGQPTFEQQLRAGLLPRTPDQEAFLARVARRVDKGKLPRDLVQSTFLWALQKPHTIRFNYFERALRRRAEQEGVKL